MKLWKTCSKLQKPLYELSKIKTMTIIEFWSVRMTSYWGANTRHANIYQYSFNLYPHVVYSLFNNWADKKGCLYTSGANFASLLPKYDDKMNEANLLSYQCYASVSCIPSYDVH